MESMTCKGRGHDPFVMSLMQSLVDQWMVQASMNPVDTEVREEDKEGELQQVVELKGGI